MIRAVLAAGLALVPLAPLTAQAAGDRSDGDALFPDAAVVLRPRFRTRGGAGGRMRIVSGGGVSAALKIDQYWFYEQVYREALGRASMRMSLPRADRLARREAIAAVFARYPERQVAAFRASPVDRPLPPPIRPGR